MMLDMSVVNYEEQKEASRSKLREKLCQKFELTDNEVTLASIDKMIKTWLRRGRERVKRIYGSKLKPPNRYTEKQWDSLKKYWSLPGTRDKSVKMSNRRSQVAHNPRVGRLGCARKAVKLRLERETTPPQSDVAAELKILHDNPSTSSIEYKNSSRLSFVERNQLETNRRLEEVIKSNLNLSNILANVLTNLTSADGGGRSLLKEDLVNHAGETCVDLKDSANPTERYERVAGSSEKWWDKLEQTSVDTEGGDGTARAGRVRSVENEVKNFDDESTGLSAKVKAKGLRTQQSSSMRNQDQQTKEGQTISLIGKNSSEDVTVGSQVWLADTLDPRRRVATGIVMALGGNGMFHNRPIPSQCIRVTLEKEIVDLPLMVPVVEADHATLSDAVGSSVLWYRGLTFVEQ
ncbi:hypothetical protein M758_UG312400 [Ceratodon purpureus]|nr:hypothetical protein M758_UG312400 [Ceratodon purpureus]